jgi:phosphatidylglycerophosphate synthase
MTTAAASSPHVLPGFQQAARVQQSLLAAWEKKCLIWLAGRMPAWVHPDHLTLLGFLSMFQAGACYALASSWAPFLLIVNFWLAVNWFGDSLDGTLARFRNRQRPRYGFYVDHIVDSFGALFLLSGLAMSGYMSWWVAFSLLVAFLLLSINSYLATYTLGTFQLSFFKFSPTELRILLAIGNALALAFPYVTVFGSRQHFFDVGGIVGVVGMGVVLVVSVFRNTRALYRMEKA